MNRLAVTKQFIFYRIVKYNYETITWTWNFKILFSKSDFLEDFGVEDIFARSQHCSLHQLRGELGPINSLFVQETKNGENSWIGDGEWRMTAMTLFHKNPHGSHHQQNSVKTRLTGSGCLPQSWSHYLPGLAEKENSPSQPCALDTGAPRHHSQAPVPQTEIHLPSIPLVWDWNYLLLHFEYAVY